MADPVKNAKGNGVRDETAGARTKGAKGAAKAAEKARDAVPDPAEAAGRAGRALGAASGTVKGAKDGLVSAGSRAGTAATVGFTVIKERKKIAAGAGAGLLALLGGAYALGRATRPRQGPLTRLTHGRL